MKHAEQARTDRDRRRHHVRWAEPGEIKQQEARLGVVFLVPKGERILVVARDMDDSYHARLFITVPANADIRLTEEEAARLFDARIGGGR